MQFWIIQTLNSVALGALLFMLSSGFSLIFGLMRVPNLAHGAFFMLGAYVGAEFLDRGVDFWLAVLASGLGVGVLGVTLERFVFRRITGNEQGQVLVTLGIAFIIADICLMVWGGDPVPLASPPSLRRPLLFFGFAFPTYRLAVLGVALAGAAGVIGGPILSAYPGLDNDMLPLALIVVILGGIGSLLGAFVGSFVIGFIYNFGTALFPDLAYVILFLPMVLVLVFLPQGLFGRMPQ